MNNFIESLKDMVYEAVDYIMILGIVVVVGLIIGWRLDILFKEDLNSDNVASIKVEESNEDTGSPNIESNHIKSETSEEEIIKESNRNLDKIEKETTEEKKSTQSKISKENSEGLSESKTEEKTNNKNSQIISIEIPSGSNSTDIANILLSNGLISSFKEFNDKSEELGLSTKLKAGKFNIESDASLEEILNIITK